MTEYAFTLTSAVSHHQLLFSDVCVCIFSLYTKKHLASELAACFYLEIGEANKAVEYCLLAHERYQEWVVSRVDFAHKTCCVLCTNFSC